MREILCVRDCTKVKKLEQGKKSEEGKRTETVHEASRDVATDGDAGKSIEQVETKGNAH